jgi:uncharacterized protein
MIAIDTQILVYSVRADSPFHHAAQDCIRRLAEGASPWALTWHNLHEFIAIVTNARIYKPPTPLSDALVQIAYWAKSPSLRLLSEGPGYLEHLALLATQGTVSGGMIHDARVAALCRAHGVRELWSADRDFSRFPGMVVRNPLTTR